MIKKPWTVTLCVCFTCLWLILINVEAANLLVKNLVVALMLICTFASMKAIGEVGND